MGLQRVVLELSASAKVMGRLLSVLFKRDISKEYPSFKHPVYSTCAMAGKLTSYIGIKLLA